MLNKGIIYYTDNRLDPIIMSACQKQLINASNNLPIISCSLKPIKFGKNIVLNLERGSLTLFKQIFTALQNSISDIIFFCEHDVLYHPTHFEFIPDRHDVFYYNTNIWKVKYPEGHAVWTDDLQQVSGICVYRNLALNFYSNRIDEIEKGIFDGHYEPNPRFNWSSKFPNIDIRHNMNMTKSKWSPKEFRNPKYAKGWKESNEVPGWGITKDNFMDILAKIN